MTAHIAALCLANVLMLMTNSLRAGYSFVKALEVCASEMSPATRRRLIEIAAALAKHFPTRDDRSRERY